MARKLIIGIAGYTGEMGGRHLRAIRTCLDRLDCTADFYLYVRHPKPVDFPATICASEEEFYTRNYDLLVLAMHPHHRRTAYLSLASGVTTANLVYLEKPLWTLSAPQQDRRVFTDFKNKYASRTVVNFQENFDPLTQLIITLLQGEKQGVPVLTVKDIFCHRSKDRTNESERLHKDNRHSEPIIIQEAVHDLGFAMHILSSLTRPLPSLQILSAHAYDLKHTTGDTIPLAGSSYAMLTTQQHDTHIMLINSFIDPLARFK